MVVIVGPAAAQNRFSSPEDTVTATYYPNRTALQTAPVHLVFPPTPIPGQSNRRDPHNMTSYQTSFPLHNYPAALDAFANQNPAIDNASSLLSTTNEQGQSVAVGYARPQSALVDWALIVEQPHYEAWAPILKLRNILLGCVFGTLGLIMLIVVPIAHFSVMPIRRLKEATEMFVLPPGHTLTGSIRSERLQGHVFSGEENYQKPRQRSKRERGFLVPASDLRRGRIQNSPVGEIEDVNRRVLKIPGKVVDRKHLITDELTELTGTFNEMSGALVTQHARLEERVAERTKELEISKKAAEVANESKTLFIANISHELKTPLNGILGLCAVCMEEDDLQRIKRSLQVVYQSGDLLLHLLNDLLTFSKNQIGRSISLEEKEFRLSDIGSQITTIFEKQVREGGIQFAIKFIGTNSIGLSPEGSSKLEDMQLWGDPHRILQVIINLVSNSLKFTPLGGKVEVRIRCVGEVARLLDGGIDDRVGLNRGSLHHVGSSSVASRIWSGSATGFKLVATPPLINPMDLTAPTTHRQVREPSGTCLPANPRAYIFEFEVEDTGAGIPPNIQQLIFEPFVQGDLGLNKKYGGTGLGLSICSQLVSLMNGTITLESTVGMGTTFNMQIPLKFVRGRTSSTTCSSLPGAQDAHAVAKAFAGDASSASMATSNDQPMVFDKNLQPGPACLSQPLITTASAPSSDTSPNDQPAARHRVAVSKDTPSKAWVLIAEDNHVNQEVMLR